jgi:putative OPT family oligopeptide transporter
VTSGPASSRPQQLAVTPYIPASKILPEITPKALILSLILTLIMAGSNAYLGLKIGMTVSATIPSAVISMAVLRLFRQSNILENNIVQTAASAGEAIAAAAVFTLPALLIMGYWHSFPFWKTFCIISIGGILGVMFSIPLRRAFVIESGLKFPEGVATAEVLKAGDNASKGVIKDLLSGGVAAAFLKISQSAFMIAEESLGFWTQKGKLLFGWSTGLSLVLVGAGYIVGISVGLSVMLGAFIAWGVGVPLYAWIYGAPEAASAANAAHTLWADHIRIMGVGTLVVGGFWTLFKLVKPIGNAISSSIEAFSKVRLGQAVQILRTEYDIPVTYVFAVIALLMLPLIYIFHDILSCCSLELEATWHWTVVLLMSFCCLIFGFMASAISGYMAGLVGSSNNPVSAVNIMCILLTSLILLALLGHQIDFAGSAIQSLSGATIAIVVTAMACNAACISGDNLQDLKSGQLVGATPWKQQVMLLVGVMVAALIMSPILGILYEAYGIGNAFPRADMDPSQALNAPTAMVLSALTKAVLTSTMNWTMFTIGAALAVVLIILEIFNRGREHIISFSPLAVAIGIYLPLDTIFPVFLGGLMAFLADKSLDRQRNVLGVDYEAAAEGARRRGLLFSSGLIAGEAVAGIILAVPFAAYQSTSIFSLRPANFESTALVIGTGIFSLVCIHLYRIGSKASA